MNQAASPSPPGSTSPAAGLVYVYGVIRANALAPSAAALVEGLVPGTSIELVPAGDLAAVVSRVPWDAFAPGAGEADSAARVLAHHRVLANLAMFCTVAPMKFGVICPSLTAVINAIANSGIDFERAIARVEGAREWRVKLHADVDVCRAAVWATISRKPRPPAPDRAGSARVYLRRKTRIDLDAEVLRDLAARAESVHRLIATQTKEAASGSECGLRTGWNGYAPALILKSAYLVERRGEAAFHQAMADLGEALEAEGCTLDISGPWPPYSFAAIDIGNTGTQDL